MSKVLIPAALAASLLPIPALAEIVTRTVDLTETGQSVQFEGLTGQTTLFLPVARPGAVTEANLVLDLMSTSAVVAERNLRVSIDGDLRRVLRLGGEGAERLALPLRPEDYARGSVRVDLAYGGAATDFECIDGVAVGDTLRVLPSSGLRLRLDGAALSTAGDVAAAMPRRVTVTGGEAAPALFLRAAALYGAEAGRLTDAAGTGNGWDVATLDLSGGDGGVGRDGLALTLGGETAQAELATLVGVAAPVGAAGTVPLSRFGTLAPMDVAERGVVRVALDRAAFAPGLRPAAAVLNVIAAPDAAGDVPSATVYFNGEILAARSLRAGEVQSIAVDLPERLLARSNTLEVVFQRDGKGGHCDRSPGRYGVQVLPTSSLRVGTARSPRDFDDLSAAMGAGVEIAADMSDPLIRDWALAATGAVVPDTAPITHAEDADGLRGDGPFMVISREVPGGMTLLTDLSPGAQVVDDQGQVLHDVAEVERATVAQIVRDGDRMGLWVRPAGPVPTLSAARPLDFGSGDVAILDASGRTLTFTTFQPDTFRLSDPRSGAGIWAQVRPWIFGGLWVAVSLLLLGGIVRAYRARRG